MRWIFFTSFNKSLENASGNPAQRQSICHRHSRHLYSRPLRSQSGPSKRSNDGFLYVWKSSEVSPRPQLSQPPRSHFSDIRISIAQTSTNQSPLDMSPTTHAPMIPLVNVTRRGHATSPLDLAVAARGCGR